MAELTALGVSIDATEVVKGAEAFDRFTAAADKTEKSAASVTAAFSRIEKSAQGVEASLARVSGSLTASGAKAEGAAKRAANANEQASKTITANNDNLVMSMNTLKSAALGLAGAFGLAFGGAAFGAGILNSINRLDAIDSSIGKINNSLKLNGYTFELTTKEIIAFADALQKATGTQSQDILNIIPNALSFGFTPEIMKRSITLANDMSKAWGGDLKQNFEGLARALADPIKGTAMLSMRGIKLDETQKALVKSLTQSGQGLQAQAIWLQALEGQVKETAEAGYTPLQKAQDRLKKSTEDFFDALVTGGGATNGLITLLNALSTAVEFLAKNMDTLIIAFGLFAAGHIAAGIAAVVVSIGILTSSLGLAAAAATVLSGALALVGGPVGAAVIALGAAYLYLTQQSREAAAQSVSFNKSIADNETSLKLSVNASDTFRKSLRDNIAVQLEAARAAMVEADAQLKAAKARVAASYDIFGIEAAGAESARKNALERDRQFQQLEAQLERVNKIIDTPAGTATDRQFGVTDQAAVKKAQAAANAYRDLVKSANDRIAQMQLEAQTAGLTGVAQDTMRFKLELLQKAQDKGRTISAAQRAELEALAASYGKVATEAARAKLVSDQMFERQQLFRSPIEQTVASTLRSAGLEVDLNSQDAAIIRTTENLKEAKQAASDFISTFRQGLMDGKSIWESFGQAALGVLDKIISKLENELINALFDSGLTGGGAGSGGGILGGLGKLFGFASGGYTGNGGRNEPAGVVHRGEYVFSKAATARLGVGTLDGMHKKAQRGYASGGYVSNAPARVQAPANANTSAIQVSVVTRMDNNGNLQSFVENIAETKSAQTSQAALAGYDSNLPNRIQQIDNNPWART